MRSNQRLNAVRSLPCVKCGKPAPSEACHANWSEYGKGIGIKASDEFVIPLCRQHHYEFDTYSSMKRDESKLWFEQMLAKTNRMLAMDETEIF
ncbi:hypothetical protein P256_00719 [Acinetobacter nectaris CIP 110549]|uniref:DUF968 domain-containing protein n=1 Tax=Acinetobacter nectaris CIP 110549 TaxID=1392540 RepID=V2TRT0_9GAMM|nr:DUF968 domain-containing protein [Acinetobacter nectaris]ESK40272.1 hypothetical protein P256_00719 [Acinetobacter nectaris CIP 110549]